MNGRGIYQDITLMESIPQVFIFPGGMTLDHVEFNFHLDQPIQMYNRLGDEDE